MEREPGAENGKLQKTEKENEEYDRIEKIEVWFENIYNWRPLGQSDDGKQGPYPEKFFDTDVDVFWDYFSMMELISFALAYKKVAYFVYNYNKKGFRDFCNEIWNKKILNLSQWEFITLKSLKTLNGMFSVKEVLFPSDVPNEILEHLPMAKVYTFNLRWDKTYATPRHAYIQSVKLIINGCFNMNMADPVSPILNKFPRISNLILNNIYFTRISIAALGTTKIKNLVITKSSLWPSGDEAFVKALQNSADTLESITLDSSSNCTWESTIKWLIIKIKSFKKLHSFSPTLRLNWQNTRSLKCLAASRSLKNVTLMTNFYGQARQSTGMMNKLKTALEPRGIALSLVERDLENFPVFMTDWN